jgi:hypothetical protein
VSTPVAVSTPAAVMLLEDAPARKYELMRAEVQDIVSRATEDAALLAELLSRGAAARKGLQSARTAAMEPTARQLRQIKGLFDEPIGQLEELDTRGKALLSAWRAQEKARVDRERQERQRVEIAAAQREQTALAAAAAATTEAERQSAMAEAEAASRAQSAAAAAMVVPASRGIKTDSGSVVGRKTWQVEVVREADVPREYLAVDMPKLRAAVKAGARQIPGCNIFEDEGLAVRPGQ